jgi:hypothetical protein
MARWALVAAVRARVAFGIAAAASLAAAAVASAARD